MMQLLQKVAFGARCNGTTVVQTIGGTGIEMSYEDAFKLSQWLRVAAKQAKQNAGDIGRHWGVVAQLTTNELQEGKSHAN